VTLRPTIAGLPTTKGADRKPKSAVEFYDSDDSNQGEPVKG
jgi:hypothetical protein